MYKKWSGKMFENFQKLWQKVDDYISISYAHGNFLLRNFCQFYLAEILGL